MSAEDTIYQTGILVLYLITQTPSHFYPLHFAKRSLSIDFRYVGWVSAKRVTHQTIFPTSLMGYALCANPSYITHQALAAQEIRLLYRWWKEERPNRVDPSEASGWNAYCDEKRKTEKAIDDISFLRSFAVSETEQQRSNQILSIVQKMEEEQEEEDTSMLIRLVKIRKNLWA